MRTILTALLLLCAAIGIRAQVVLEPAKSTIKCGKAAITCLAVSPKNDKVLVGTNNGAELMDLNTGKRLFSFPYNEDKGTAVYHVAFNPNGEFVVLIGATGKRQVWDVKTGAQDKVIAPHRWIPDAVQVRNMGLGIKNSLFDRFYQQSEAERGTVKAKADRNGSVVFTDAQGGTLQTLAFPTNKDQHHRAPLLFHEDSFLTGTDDGRVLIYGLTGH